jgi:hypothetical protein
LTDVITRPFNPAALLKRIDSDGFGTSFKIIPGGRQLKGALPKTIQIAARHLACAMIQDPPKEYPLPFFLTEARRAER